MAGRHACGPGTQWHLHPREMPSPVAMLPAWPARRTMGTMSQVGWGPEAFSPASGHHVLLQIQTWGSRRSWLAKQSYSEHLTGCPCPPPGQTQVWVREGGDKRPSHMASFPRAALQQPEILAPIFLHSRPQTSSFSTLPCGTHAGSHLPLRNPAHKAMRHQTSKPKLH